MNDIKTAVRDKYGSIAEQAGERATQAASAGQEASCCAPDCCGSADGRSTATTTESSLVDYSELGDQVVAGSNLGLGCGIPTKHASLQAGEVVLDLGSGAGIDVFLAAQAVGTEGRAIGVDMTPQMIERANAGAAEAGLQNVEFRLGDIEDLPVEDDSVDVVLSNCVINLAPDKRRVFSEIFRVLRPAGGRFSISDIVTHGPVPDAVRTDIENWTGCIAGALDREEYLQVIRAAGFTDVNVKEQRKHDTLGSTDYGFMSVTVEGHRP